MRREKGFHSWPKLPDRSRPRGSGRPPVLPPRHPPPAIGHCHLLSYRQKSSAPSKSHEALRAMKKSSILVDSYWDRPYINDICFGWCLLPLTARAILSPWPGYTACLPVWSLNTCCQKGCKGRAGAGKSPVAPSPSPCLDKSLEMMALQCQGPGCPPCIGTQSKHSLI